MSASLFLLGCGGDGSSTPSSTQSLIPSEFSIAINGLKFTSENEIEVLENQKGVIDINAETVKGGTLTYSIYGTDADKFIIDKDTGLVTFKETPDYETQKTYYFTIKVSDNNAELSQDITVIIKNINDTAPTIISSATNIINEKQKLAIDVDATDADEGDVLTYSIYGTDAKSFDINSSSGVVSFLVAPDYSETKYMYTFTALVSDGENETSQDITITIRDPKANNNAPVFTSEANATVEENQISAITIVATDEDGDTLTYSISGEDADSFDIDSGTGVVTFKEAPDYETKKSYKFTAKVSDGIEEAIQEVAITIIDISDAAPIITSSATATVPENQTSAITVTATDDDEGDTLTYSISGIDAASFNIDSSTGVVTFKTAPDYETKNEYNFIVTVSDGNDVTDNATQNITITITNVNDGTPSINTPNAVEVKENQLFVIDVNATDLDGDTLTYAISDTDTFNINETTGQITFIIAPDYESGKINYNPTVIVSDAENNVTQSISITIINDESDDNRAPVITSEATATVVENETTAITISATDEDGDTLTYSISGEDAASFDINSTSGVVTFKIEPDYETKKSYSFTATVSDGNTTATQDITITITDDESDNATNVAPTFTSSATVEVEENQLSAIDIDATDDDEDTLTYSISGEDADSFDINSTSGVVTFKEEPDYETKTSYSFTATVSDGNTTTEDATQDITITITDDEDE